MGGLFSKDFSWGDKPLGQTYWGLFYKGGLMIALSNGKGSSTNTFSSNMNTIDPKFFPKHGGIEFIFEVNS